MKLVKENCFYKLIKEDSILAKIDLNGHTPIRYPLGKLSLKNCNEIFGVVDVEKLAEYQFRKSEYEIKLRKEAFVIGFNKAMELNKDKVFTRADMIHALTYGVREAKLGRTHSQILEEYRTNHLQQPTEIDIEIEMEWLPIATFCTACGNGGEYMKTPCDHKNDCSHWAQKLDSNGCLILKRAK